MARDSRIRLYQLIWLMDPQVLKCFEGFHIISQAVQDFVQHNLRDYYDTHGMVDLANGCRS